MRIKLLSGKSIKNAESFVHELGPVNIFVGPNASGKTARLDAIRLALVGYLPELGKTNAATWQLSSGEIMLAGIELEHGGKAWQVARTWTPKGKSITSEVVWPAQVPEVPPVLVDTKVYLDLTEGQQTKFLFGLLNLGESGWTGERIVREIKSLKPGIPENAAEKESLAKIVAEIDEMDHERHQSGASIQDWVERLIEEFKQRVSVAEEGKRRMERYVQGAVELKAKDAEANQINAGRELAETRATLEKVNADMTRLQTLAEAGRSMERQKALAQERLARPFDAEGHAQAREEYGRLTKLVDRYKSATGALALVEQKWQMETGQVGSQLSLVKATVEEMKARHAKELAAEACPYCGSSGVGWKKTLKKKQTVQLKAEEDKLPGLGKEFDQCHARFVAENAKVQESKKNDAAHEANLEKQTTLLKLCRAYEQELAERTAAQTVLDTLAKHIAPTPEELENLKLMERQRDELRERIEELALEQKNQIAAQHEAKRQAEARMELDLATAESSVLKAVVILLRDVQERMIEEVFKRLVKDLNSFMDGFPLSLVYRNGQVGKINGTAFVPHHTFSGTEKALTYAALSAVLAKDSPIKIVLVDELSRMTKKNKLAFVGTMIRLVKEGKVDQFVGIDLKDDYEPLKKECKVIGL